MINELKCICEEQVYILYSLRNFGKFKRDQITTFDSVYLEDIHLQEIELTLSQNNNKFYLSYCI